MRKFEVGDVVRVVNEAEHRHGRKRSYAGAVGFVDKLSKTDDGLSISFGANDAWWFGSEELELCQESDPINHPAHYAGSNGIECIDAMRATLTPDEFRGYCKGAAFKYIWRERHKGGNESLAKAVWYLSEAQK